MPKLPAFPGRAVGLSLLALAVAGLVAGGVWQARHEQAARMVMQALGQEVRTNNPAPLAYALDHGGDPNATSDYGTAPPRSVRVWIQSLLAPRSGGQSALDMAACLHQLAAVRLLLAHGAKATQRGPDGKTPIMDMAAEGGMDSVEYWKSAGFGPVPQWARDQDEADKETLSLLVSHGANINGATDEGETALMMAASRHCVACVRLLLDDGAKASLRADNGETALTDAVGVEPDTLYQRAWGGYADHRDAAIVHLLLAHGADPNQTLSSGVPLLGWAASSSQAPIVLQLLQAGANADVKDSSGITVLNDAIRHGDAKVVRAALDHGAHPNDLMTTFDPDRPDLLKLLLEHGGDPNTGQNGWRTPLTAAAYQHDLPMARLLLAHGAHVNQATTDDRTTALIEDAHQRVRRTPMDRAAQLAIASLLLAHGANPKLADKSGKTALAVARANGDGELVKLLLSHGAS